MPPVVRTRFLFAAALLVAAPAFAQHEHHDAPPATGRAWTLDSSTLLTANVQERRFRDFHQVESQNWLTGLGTRRAGGGTLTLHGMFSLEPFSMRDLGSSQVFQTGETFDLAPLIDYQHPHDLFMGLSIGYERPVGRARLLLRGGPVDERRWARPPSCTALRRRCIQPRRSPTTRSTRRISLPVSSPRACASATGSSRRRRSAAASRMKIGSTSTSAPSIRTPCAAAGSAAARARNSRSAGSRTPTSPSRAM